MFAKIITLSILAFFALNAHGKPMCASEKKCAANIDGEACVHNVVGMYQTTYLWLNNFIWETTFPETTLKMSKQNLNVLVQQELQEHLRGGILNLNDPDFQQGYEEFIITWDKPEENENYLQIRSDNYFVGLGAAHGLNSATYYIFKKSDPHQLEQDIVLPEGKQKLSQLLQQTFIEYLMNKKYDPLNLTEAQRIADQPIEPSTWHFAKNMIVFDYNPYEIAAYAFGAIHLPVSVIDLKGLVKEDILQAAQEWSIPYDPDRDSNKDYDLCIGDLF